MKSLQEQVDNFKKENEKLKNQLDAKEATHQAEKQRFLKEDKMRLMDRCACFTCMVYLPISFVLLFVRYICLFCFFIILLLWVILVVIFADFY